MGAWRLLYEDGKRTGARVCVAWLLSWACVAVRAAAGPGGPLPGPLQAGAPAVASAENEQIIDAENEPDFRPRLKIIDLILNETL